MTSTRTRRPTSSAGSAGSCDAPGAAPTGSPQPEAGTAGDRLRQLRYRSRRGLLELELLLLPFAAERLDALAPEDLDAYEQLLGCEDLDIYDWLQGRSAPPDAALEAIVADVARFNATTPRS